MAKKRKRQAPSPEDLAPSRARARAEPPRAKKKPRPAAPSRPAPSPEDLAPRRAASQPRKPLPVSQADRLRWAIEAAKRNPARARTRRPTRGEKVGKTLLGSTSYEVLSNLADQAAASAAGLPPGLVRTGASLLQDALDPQSRFKRTRRTTIDPIAESYRWQYGPLFSGDVEEAASRAKEAPLGPLLDLTAVLGATASGASRVAAAGRAVKGREPGTSVTRAAARGLTRPKRRGFLTRKPKEDELLEMEDEIRGALASEQLELAPAPKQGRRARARQGVENVKADLRATREAGKGKGLLGAIETTVREASDGLRAGIIYVRPTAYAGGNIGSNTFLNLTDQGFLGPVNLAKSFALNRHLSPEAVRVIDTAMGLGATEAIHGAGRGYVKAVTAPLIRGLGKGVDRPFRRAAFLQEARRSGRRKLADVERLIQEATTDKAKLREFSEMAVRANEEIVKFGKLSEAEQTYARTLFFVWNWTRAASRYSARYPFRHPVQSSAYLRVGEEGIRPLEEELENYPPWLRGALLSGEDEEGNPKLRNLGTINPLTTGVDLARASAGGLKVLGGQDFDKFQEEDFASLLNPLLRTYLEAREGGRSFPEGIVDSVALARLGREALGGEGGKTFPSSLDEEMERFLLGPLAERTASREAIEEAGLRGLPSDERSKVRAKQDFREWEGATRKTLGLSKAEPIPAAFVRAKRNAILREELGKRYKEQHGVERLDERARLRVVVETMLQSSPGADRAKWLEFAENASPLVAKEIIPEIEKRLGLDLLRELSGRVNTQDLARRQREFAGRK
jgi:hypothetical protein